MSRSSNFILCLLLQPTFLCGRVVNVEDLVETPPEAASTRAEQESWEEIVAHVIIVVVVVVVVVAGSVVYVQESCLHDAHLFWTEATAAGPGHLLFVKDLFLFCFANLLNTKTTHYSIQLV